LNDLAGEGFVLESDEDFAGAIGKGGQAGFDIVFAQGQDDHARKIGILFGCDFNRGIVGDFVLPIAVSIIYVRRRFVLLPLEFDGGIHFGIVRIIEIVAINYHFSWLEKFRQHANSEVSFGVLKIEAFVLNDMIWNFRGTQFGTVSYTLLLTSANPDFAKIGILNLIAGSATLLSKTFDEIRLAVGANGKTRAVFGFAFRAKHNGRRVYNGGVEQDSWSRFYKTYSAEDCRMGTRLCFMLVIIVALFLSA
jgi:hypothetical protein